MPHLKVNVNGTRYTISGLTRRTCSSQILCALAKVDAELQLHHKYLKNGNEEREATDEKREIRSTKCHKFRESRRKVDSLEIRKSDLESESKSAEDNKSAVRIKQSTRKTQGTEKEGIQSFSGIPKTLDTSIETQQSCVQTQQEVPLFKEKVLEEYLLAEEYLKQQNGAVREGSTNINSDQAKETDHDTGISELQSDSSFELSQLTGISMVTDVNQFGEEKGLHSLSNVNNYASTDIAPSESTDTHRTCMCVEKSETTTVGEDFVVATLISDSETENQCSCFAVDVFTEELEDEIEQFRENLRLTEAKLAKQNKMVELLISQIDVDESKMAGNLDDKLVSSDEDERIRELKQSIKLSGELNDYQKIEMQANCMELERVESKIRRKRWHVESLLQELHSVRRRNKREATGSYGDYATEGTLV